jgi:hypothetical protein
VRRVIVLIVLAIVGAGWYGFAASSTALAVNGTSVSETAFQGELHALATNSGLFCYMSSLANTAISKPGAGRDSVTATTEAQWANLRVEGIAIDHYVAQTLHYHPNAAALASAKVSLEGELAQAATQTSNTCPGTPAQALAAMPAEMRAAQIEDQASSVYLVSKLNKTIALTAANIKAYYESHLSKYETLCIAVAVVDPTKLSAFAASQTQGLSVAALAKKYSLDPSASKGGSYGCILPTSTSYSAVRTDIGTAKVGHFPTTPISYTPTQGGPTYGLFVAATSKIRTPFAKAQSEVISNIQSANSTAANSVKAGILYAAAVDIDPAYGRWGLSSSGPGVFVPGLPGESGPSSTSHLSTASSLPYQ